MIVGAGGCGIDILWTINDCNRISRKYEVIGFIDKSKFLKGKTVNNIEILGDDEWFSNHEIKNLNVVVAIGNSKARFNIVKKLEKYNVDFPIIIHPSVICSELEEIGEGSVIQAGCVLGPNTKLGRHVQVNMNCTIGHGSVLNDFVSLTTGVHINGNNVVGTGTLIGSGATTTEKIKIGKWAIVSIGSVVGEDVPDNVLVLGNPARPIKPID